jgi:hypothetical protein
MNKTKFRCWITVKENIIVEVHRSNTDQSIIGMIEIPWNSDAKINTHIKLYDKNWKRLSEEELIKKGKLIDNRGQYWNKENYLDTLTIAVLDEDVPEGYTDTAPIPCEPCIWKNGKWIIDEEKKARQAMILKPEEALEFVSGFVSEIIEADND